MSVDWNGFGPQVVIFEQIRKMANSIESWFEELWFYFNKHPQVSTNSSDNRLSNYIIYYE